MVNSYGWPSVSVVLYIIAPLDWMFIVVCSAVLPNGNSKLPMVNNIIRISIKLDFFIRLSANFSH